MAFAFNRGYAEIRELGEVALKEASLDQDKVDWLLDCLKKYGTVEMVSEFLKGLDRSSDRILDQGYLNALSDFLNFAKNYK
ncbi:hypothetical protein SEA_MOAB_210 [Streptomyces phage Moab]|nr:hypothetical protein SEA_MOAB_210 [Streptomyces phage Moab]WMI33814.1 hypothetical protein SEA_PATELGO_212 [Streptomyces phage Patelgo]